MILDNIDQILPEQLAAGVYQLLYSGEADFETQEKLKDRRLIPILNTIVQTKGRPPFAPRQDLPKKQTDHVMMLAAYLLGDIARPEDTETIRTLMDALDYENDTVKLAAATALGQIGATEASAKVLAFTEQMIAQNEMGAVSKLTRTLALIGGEDAKARLANFIAQNRGAEDKHAQHVVAEAETAISSIDQRLA